MIRMEAIFRERRVWRRRRAIRGGERWGEEGSGWGECQEGILGEVVVVRLLLG
jgi:hypothetical protein